MKNLITLLLLAVSAMTFGQTKSQKEEIKYWKSIAESNDTVAYLQYLNRYGENGLYYDEAITRITLLKTSGKQSQSKSTECCFYTQNKTCSNCAEYVVRFDGSQAKVWFKRTVYDTIRSNLAMSRDFYENQVAVSILRCQIKDVNIDVNIIGKITDSNKNVLSGATILATHTSSGLKYHCVTDASGNFRLELPNSGTYQIEFRMDGFPSYVTSARTNGQFLNVFLNEESSSLCQVVAEAIRENRNVWTVDDEYQYNPMKSTSARDVYFRRDMRGTIQGYRYIAFSKDKSSIIMWFEEDKNLDGRILEKTNYYRVPKEDLLPKAVNYDFLNE